MKQLLATIVLLAIPLALFGRVVPVDIVENTTERVPIVADHIPEEDELDVVNEEFTALQKENIKTRLALTPDEARVSDAVLGGHKIDANDLSAFVSLLNKQLSEKELSGDEKKKLFGMDGQVQRDPSLSVRYLERKAIREAQCAVITCLPAI